MAQKVIRGIPENVMQFLKEYATASGKESTEEWIRDLLISIGTPEGDGGTRDQIRLEVGRIDDMLDSLKAQIQPWVGSDNHDVVRPVQCLISMLLIKSDLFHAMNMMSKAIGTCE